MLTKENFIASCQAARKMNSLDDDLDIEQIVKDANKMHRIVFPELYRDRTEPPGEMEETI